MTTNVLIIGSGIAGFAVAIKLASAFPDKRISIITKKDFLDSNTNLAQGGIAAVIDTKADSFEKHIADTLAAGDGMGNRVVVEQVVREAPTRLAELQQWGVVFDATASGNIELGVEGGHSAARIVHHKDTTGNYVAEALLAKVRAYSNIELLPHHLAIDLMTRTDTSSGSKSCSGAVVLNVKTGNVFTVASSVTVLATGGVGQVFETTTNPLVATGDGIAMAWRAGAAVTDMEFIQFHPTAFYSTEDNPSFLISEAVRGFGAYLRGEKGDRFVLKYDHRGELASRDIVSKAIFTELAKEKSNAVFLDCRHLPPNELLSHFPAIYQRCLSKGIDLSKNLIPVAPAAHYLCGGIVTDINAQTSIGNLYACGECARTGLHGANRLASNSLLEALVFAHHAFEHIRSLLPGLTDAQPIVREESVAPATPSLDWITQNRKKLRATMSRCAGIVRTDAMLRAGIDEIHQQMVEVEEHYASSFPDINLVELRNMLVVSRLILEQSLSRTENKGTYYNSDREK